MNELSRLLDIGFVKVGAWELTANGSHMFVGNGIDLHAIEGGILYAFVVEGKVQYIGKSVQRFAKRFVGYAKPGPSQKTNLRISPLIKAALERGTCVEVYGFSKFDTETYPGFRLSHSAGLEDSLINMLRPSWNFLGNRKE